MAYLKMPSFKSAEVGDKQYYINLLNIYLPNFIKKLNVHSITPHLVEKQLLKLDDVRDIDEHASRNRKSAVVKLMHTLTKSTDPEWFHKFKDALKKSDHQIIFTLMNSDVDEEDVKNEEAYEELLTKHYATVVNTIEPVELLPELLQRKTISKSDFEEIEAESLNYGKSRAAQKLLTCIPCLKNGWFVDFIAALKKANYKPVVELFSLELGSAKSDMSIAREVDKIANKTPSPGVKHGYESTSTKENVDKKSSEEFKRSVPSSLTEDCSSVPKPSMSKQDFDQPTTSMKDDHSYEADEYPYPSNIVELREDEEDDFCALPSGQSQASSATGVMRQQPARAAASPPEDRTLTDCYDFRSDVSNDLSRPSSQGPSGPKLPSLSASADPFTTLTPEETDTPVTKKRLELRGYQKELAEKGVEGKNCVIVAPTGSGKTHVAMYISQQHLNSNPENNPKILFFVPKVALVQQQRKQYQTYMHDNCKVFSVSGEKDAQMSLKEIFKNNDVIVLTPQILVNAIDSGDMDGSFSQVTLMFFDECHHAMKDHPYNNIMSRYIDIVLSRDEEKIHHLPQVIGLTASPGVGKAKSDEDAIDHLIKLCANLDASDICTVRNKDHQAELQKNVNIPVEDIEEVKGRDIDRFHEVISGIMAEIETKMSRRNDINKLMVEVPNIQKVLEPPTRGLEAYTQFLANLKREVAKIYDQEIRRFFLSCQEHLEVYNNALLINADCRTIDAFDFIRKQFADRNSGHRASLPNNETDQWLNKLYNAKAMYLEKISDSPESANPKLKYLENRILGFYRENEDSQGIIFCKTRYMTDALVKWIKDTPRLAFLNPHNLVGAGSTTGRAAALNPVSMTHRKLDDVLKYFKGGIHKIIVATSVAEEGLDVKSCNYVIRYEHVTNDIARVQSRGRARAEDGKFVLVAEKGRGVHEREMTNQVREELMGKAIFLVHQIPEETMRSKIMIQQELAKRERDMAAEAKVINASWKASHEGDYQLRCFKCNAFGVWNVDLRTIKGSHHVVLDPDFKSQIEIEPHPRPKAYDDFEKKGKLLCKMCGLDWGISALYKNVPVYMLKVCSFVVEDPNSQRLFYKKWKDVPFPVNELLPEDMKILPSVFRGSRSEL